MLDLGLRVRKLGQSSVVYEVGVFKAGEDTLSAVGGYTHVFVTNADRKSAPFDEHTRRGLQRLLREVYIDKAKL